MHSEINSLGSQRRCCSDSEVFNKLRALSSNDSDKETYRKIADGSYQLPYLKIVNPTPEVMEVLKMSGFDMLISIEKDLKKAVESI